MRYACEFTNLGADAHASACDACSPEAQLNSPLTTINAVIARQLAAAGGALVVTKSVPKNKIAIMLAKALLNNDNPNKNVFVGDVSDDSQDDDNDDDGGGAVGGNDANIVKRLLCFNSSPEDNNHVNIVSGCVIKLCATTLFTTLSTGVTNEIARKIVMNAAKKSIWFTTFENTLQAFFDAYMDTFPTRVGLVKALLCHVKEEARKENEAGDLDLIGNSDFVTGVARWGAGFWNAIIVGITSLNASGWSAVATAFQKKKKKVHLYTQALRQSRASATQRF
jgi:hypothetical protein